MGRQGWWKLVAALGIALVLGVGSAVARVRILANIDDIRVGPWRGSSLVGSTQAGWYLRAVIAVNGILALGRQEALYFTASTDDDGQPLTGACRYRVTGSDPPTRWWSLTAYGPDRFLIPDAAHRYSVTRNTVHRAADGTFDIAVSATPGPRDAIASGLGRFSLTLRAYSPDAVLAAPPPGFAFPRIRREACP